MNWTHQIANAQPPEGDTSQNGETGPLFFILSALGILDAPSMLVTEFGAGDGKELSNSYPLRQRGWSARMYDVNPRGATDVIQTRVTMHNAGEFALGCNVLMIDIDSNDFWVMSGALRSSSPAVILCEINTRFERHESFTVPYDPNMEWDGSNYFGMSLEAAIRLGRHHGYSPVHLHCNYNLFLVRNDLLPAGPLPELKYGKFIGGFKDTTKPFEYIP